MFTFQGTKKDYSIDLPFGPNPIANQLLQEYMGCMHMAQRFLDQCELLYTQETWRSSLLIPMTLQGPKPIDFSWAYHYGQWFVESTDPMITHLLHNRSEWDQSSPIHYRGILGTLTNFFLTQNKSLTLAIDQVGSVGASTGYRWVSQEEASDEESLSD
jgi:hypothetical protein